MRYPGTLSSALQALSQHVYIRDTSCEIDYHNSPIRGYHLSRTIHISLYNSNFLSLLALLQILPLYVLAADMSPDK
jgi:hypothetical protein